MLEKRLEVNFATENQNEDYICEQDCWLIDSDLLYLLYLSHKPLLIFIGVDYDDDQLTTT